MLKIRRPLGRLIFNMGIAIPGETVFLIETAPWCYEFSMANISGNCLRICQHFWRIRNMCCLSIPKSREISLSNTYFIRLVVILDVYKVMNAVPGCSLLTDFIVSLGVTKNTIGWPFLGIAERETLQMLSTLLAIHGLSRHNVTDILIAECKWYFNTNERNTLGVRITMHWQEVQRK